MDGVTGPAGVADETLSFDEDVLDEDESEDVFDESVTVSPPSDGVESGLDESGLDESKGPSDVVWEGFDES